MKQLAIALAAAGVFGFLVSCGSEIDRIRCERKGIELKAEARIIGNRCVVKGWGDVR